MFLINSEKKLEYQAGAHPQLVTGFDQGWIWTDTEFNIFKRLTSLDNSTSFTKATRCDTQHGLVYQPKFYSEWIPPECGFS